MFPWTTFCFSSLHQVKEFDSISRLDQWLTTMLLRIKKSIQGDGEGDGDLKWGAVSLRHAAESSFISCESQWSLWDAHSTASFRCTWAWQCVCVFKLPCVSPCCGRVGRSYAYCECVTGCLPLVRVPRVFQELLQNLPPRYFSMCRARVSFCHMFLCPFSWTCVPNPVVLIDALHVLCELAPWWIL